jgi:hypothetical protein
MYTRVCKRAIENAATVAADSSPARLLTLSRIFPASTPIQLRDPPGKIYFLLSRITSARSCAGEIANRKIFVCVRKLLKLDGNGSAGKLGTGLLGDYPGFFLQSHTHLEWILFMQSVFS